MSFFFVDRITEYEPGKYIRGIKNITRNENFYYPLPDGSRVISPAVVSEALAQLGSWLMLASTEFTKRSVLLSDEKTVYSGVATTGDTIELYIELIDFQDEVVVSSGQAKVNGNIIQSSTCARGYLLDCNTFTDPKLDKQLFNKLFRPIESTERILKCWSPNSFYRNNFSENAISLMDGLVEVVKGKKVTAFKNFSRSEKYFDDHFPNKPVVPGVILMTMVGETAQYLVKEQMNTSFEDKVLVPTFTENVRFRKFVEPGDACTVSIEVVSGDLQDVGSEILVKAFIFAGKNRVMQAKMGLKVFQGEGPYDFSNEHLDLSKLKEISGIFFSPGDQACPTLEN